MIGLIVDHLVGIVVATPHGMLALAILGSLDVVGSLIVKTTKTVKDDEWLEKAMSHKILGPVLKAVEKFSYFDLKK